MVCEHFHGDQAKATSYTYYKLVRKWSIKYMAGSFMFVYIGKNAQRYLKTVQILVYIPGTFVVSEEHVGIEELHLYFLNVLIYIHIYNIHCIYI